MKKILNIPNRILFLVMVGVVLFWYTGKNFNVYSNTFSGALYELLSLPMLALPVLLAALALWNLFRAIRNRSNMAGAFFGIIWNWGLAGSL